MGAEGLRLEGHTAVGRWGREASLAEPRLATSPGRTGLLGEQQAAPPWAPGAEALLRFSWPEPTKSWPPSSRASGQGGPVARGGGLQLGAAGGS